VKAFSISSIQSTHGAMRSTRRRASRRLRSDSPMYGASSLPASRASSGSAQAAAIALAARLLPHPWTPSSRMPLGGSRGFSPAPGSRPALRVPIQRFNRSRPPTWSSPSGVGMNSSSPPPSTRPFFISRMRGRSATVSALSSTMARARARSASNIVRPWRSVTMPSASGRESESFAVGLSCGMRRMTRASRSRSSSGPGSANSKRTAMSESSAFSGIAGPTRTIVRAEPANSCADTRSRRRVPAASR
jgi:hypothetical protein